MTICALSTGIGASGVAIIRISGPETSFLIKSITESIAKKQFILFNAWLADNRLILLVLLSIPFLLHSMLIPFKWNLESWMDFMPFVKQFRAPGRFSWVFFFVITICTVYALDQMIQSIKNKYIQFTIIIAVAFLYFAEGVHNLHTVATSFVNTNEAFLYLDKESPLSKLSRNVQADKYQAIVSLPYHHVGSDVYVKHVNTQNSLKPSLQLSHELGLPLLSIHLTRTSLTEATNLLQLFSSDYEKRDIVSDFKSTKPFLVFFTGEELTKKEQTILSKAKTIQIEDDRVLAELEFTDLF